jgi:hypothetical protein
VDGPDQKPAGDAVHVETDPPGGGVMDEVTDLGQWLHESPPSRSSRSLEIHPEKRDDSPLSTYL